MPQSSRPKVLGTVLIVVGVILVLGVLAAFGWQQWQGAMLRQQLRAQPIPQTSPTGILAALLKPTDPVQATPTTEPSAAPAPDTPAATPVATSSPAATQPSTATPAGSPPTKPVRLQIPDLKIDVPVTDMDWKIVQTANGPASDWVIPENSAGWAINSSRLGEPGNMVLSGHNNIFGRVLMSLSQAWPGTGVESIDDFTERSNILDGHKIILQGEDGRQVEYVVKSFYRVKDTGVTSAQRIKNGKYMDPTSDTRLTLTTCWPSWSNTHRLVLIAQPAG